MRRHESGIGCGARGRGSQPRTREAPGDPIEGHYDPSAGSVLDWDWPQGLVPGNADPGNRNRRDGAPKGATHRQRCVHKAE
jgi:hypothetical protein